MIVEKVSGTIKCFFFVFSLIFAYWMGYNNAMSLATITILADGVYGQLDEVPIDPNPEVPISTDV